MAFDWGSFISTAVETGTKLYDVYNQNQVAGTLHNAAISPAVDAYGADERQRAQDEMRALRADPSSIENTPGYQFAFDQGMKGVDRGTAKGGHFRGTNRLYDLQKTGAGLASQTYDTTMDRLQKEAGAQFAPDAGAYASLTETGAGIQGGTGQGIAEVTGGNTLEKWGGILSNFSEALGGDSSEGGILDGLGESLGIDTSGVGDWFEGIGDDVMGGIEDFTGLDIGGMGDSISGTLEEYGLDDIDYMGAGKRLLSGEDPKEVLTDTAVDYAKEKGLDYLKTEGADFVSDNTGLDLNQFGYGSQFGAAHELGGGAVERATSLYNSGSGANVDLGGSYADTGYTPDGAVADTGGLSSAGVAGASAVGGIVGGYLGDNYINPMLGGFGETPLAAQGARWGGAVGGAAVYGAGSAMASGGSAAAGAAAGAGAVAGPLAIAAAAYIIGSGFAGLKETSRKKEETHDSTMKTYGEWYSRMSQGGLVDDPTGGGLGKGYDYMDGGHRFFVPDKFHKMQYNKNMYGTDTNFRDHSNLQGNYASYYDPTTGQWHEGEFGNYSATGDSTHDWAMDSGTWGALEGRKSFADNPTMRGWAGKTTTGTWGNSYDDLQSAWTGNLNEAIESDAANQAGAQGNMSTSDWEVSAASQGGTWVQGTGGTSDWEQGHTQYSSEQADVN